MLSGLRKNAKQILWPLTIALVITMGGYGVWYLIRPEPSAETVGALWGEEVSMQQFIRAYRAVVNLARINGQAIQQQDLIRMAWQRIILAREAEKMGIRVDRESLVRSLGSIPIFLDEGKFDQERFKAVLESLGVDNQAFEEQVRTLLEIEETKANIQDQALISANEVREVYRRFNEKVVIDYIEFPREEFAGDIEPDEARVRNYFEENRASFSLQTRVSVRYVVIPRAMFEEEVELTDEEIAAFYRDNRASFAEETGEPPPELAEVEDEIRKVLTAEKADAAMEKMAEEFDDLLLEITELEKAAEEFDLPVRETGLFAVDEPVAEIGESDEINRTAFSLRPGEISYPISLPGRICFLEFKESAPARQLSFEEAREEVEEAVNRELTEEETLKAARDERERIVTAVSEEEITFKKAAEEAGLTVQTSPPFTREGSEDLPRSDVLTRAAFLVPTGEISQVVPIESGYAFFRVRDRLAAEPMPEDETEKWETVTERMKMAMVFNAWFDHLIRQSKFSIIRADLKP